MHNRARAAYPVSNIVPAWLLCYWRLLRTTAHGDFAMAWKLLPDQLPKGVRCPTAEIMAMALVDHGLVKA